MLKKILAILGVCAIAFAAPEIEIDSLDDLSKYAPKKSEDKPEDAQTRDNSKVMLKFNKKEVMSMENLSIDDLKALAPTNEVDLDVSDDKVYQDIKPKELTLKASGMPKKVYYNQIFKIDFSVYLGQKITVTPKLEVSRTGAIKWLNEDKLAWIEGDEMFETTLWFEASGKDAKINELVLTLERNGEFFEKSSIKPANPEFVKLDAKANFSHIVADDLKLKNYKTAKFDDASNLLTLDLGVRNGAIGSFHIDNPSIVKQGADSVRGTYASQSGYYFAVVDNNVTNLDFSYFNLQTKKFENFGLELNPRAEDLSTQIGLNPKESKFEAYKQIAIYTLAAGLLVMFLLSKNITPLIFAALVLAVNFYMQKPYGTGQIAKDSAVRILPMQGSTIFYVTKNAENVEILGTKNDYYKIMLAGNKIGWIKKDVLSKN